MNARTSPTLLVLVCLLLEWSRRARASQRVVVSPSDWRATQARSPSLGFQNLIDPQTPFFKEVDCI